LPIYGSSAFAKATADKATAFVFKGQRRLSSVNQKPAIKIQKSKGIPLPWSLQING